MSTLSSQASDYFKLAGGTIIVTGGSRGIGYAYSSALAEVGSNVGIIYKTRRKDAQRAAKELQEKFGVKVSTYKCDVRDFKSLQHAFGQIEKEMSSRITGVIANAGISVVKSALELDEEDFQKAFGVNFFGVFNTCRAAARLWTDRNQEDGSIVITASMSAQIVNQAKPDQALTQAFYNSSKAAVRMLSRTLAAEWAVCKIRVNSISPGYVKTEQTYRLGEDVLRHQRGTVPLQRFAEPKEIAPQALLLLSRRGEYMTGGDYVVDGGHLVW